jgi:hypothetical protein
MMMQYSSKRRITMWVMRRQQSFGEDRSASEGYSFY